MTSPYFGWRTAGMNAQADSCSLLQTALITLAGLGGTRQNGQHQLSHQKVFRF
jgi:hypothetical protein